MEAIRRPPLIPADAVLQISCILPFLLIFSLGLTIDLQALLISMTGLLAWVTILANASRQSWKFSSQILSALLLYLGTCLVSLIVHPSINNLFGSDLVRLGSLTLVACIGCGLLVTAVTPKKLLTWLYGTGVLIAVVTLPYNWLVFHSLVRIGGVFHQPDLLAAWLASSFILGLGVWQFYPHQKRCLLVSQATMAGVLLLTQTRAVIGALILILFLVILRSSWAVRKRAALCVVMIIGLLAVFLTVHALSPSRLTDTGYAQTSAGYRLSLQKYAVLAALQQPLTGYGAGSLQHALRCSSLHAIALQETCSQGYYFDSSHNIYLDRVLAIGIIGGVALVWFSVGSLYRGLRVVGPERYFAYTALFICVYYCTNVTNIELELLLWITLLRAYRVKV